MNTSTLVVPFIKATADVFKEMLDLGVTGGEPQNEGDVFVSRGFTVIVGFTGGWRGRFLLDMTQATAVKLATILTGEEYTSFADEEVLLSGAEIANIISGNAITTVNNNFPKINIRLTPPSVFAGEGLSMFNIKLNSCSVVIKTEAGPVKINVAVEEGKQ